MKKILVIRFSSIGDIVLTTPVIRSLKKSFPEAEIHYLTKSSFAAVLSDNPYIDELHLLKESFSRTILDLKGENFDLIVDLHKNLRTKRVKNNLRGSKLSFDKLNYEKWKAVNFKKIEQLPNLHLVDRYFDELAKIGVSYDGKGLDYFVSSEDERVLDREGLKEKKYAIFVAGAAHFTKKIPDEKVVELAEKINFQSVIIGSRTDDSAIFHKEGIINLCGKTSLNESAALIKYAACVVTADTGMMHIAVAFKKKMAVLWGNTIPQFGMYPFDHNEKYQSFEVKGLSCRPCSKIGYQKCPKGHFKCMMEQDFTSIAAYINKKSPTE